MRPWLGEIVVFVTFVCFAVENRMLLTLSPEKLLAKQEQRTIKTHISLGICEKGAPHPNTWASPL
jgi:hypothetical protein